MTHHFIAGERYLAELAQFSLSITSGRFTRFFSNLSFYIFYIFTFFLKGKGSGKARRRITIAIAIAPQVRRK